MYNYIKAFIIISKLLCIDSFISSMSIIDKNYRTIKYKVKFVDSYIDLRPPKKLYLSENKKCDICGEVVNVKMMIPYNCTIPLGCPFNRKSSK